MRGAAPGWPSASGGSAGRSARAGRRSPGRSAAGTEPLPYTGRSSHGPGRGTACRSSRLADMAVLEELVPARDDDRVGFEATAPLKLARKYEPLPRSRTTASPRPRRDSSKPGMAVATKMPPAPFTRRTTSRSCPPGCAPRDVVQVQAVEHADVAQRVALRDPDRIAVRVHRVADPAHCCGEKRCCFQKEITGLPS